MTSSSTPPPPCLCSGQRGIGGVIRKRREDFVVEELPRYEPSGSGEHAYLWIEKEGLSTMDAVRRLCRALGVKPRAAGYAGAKDAQAITRQWISLHGVDPKDAEGLEERGLRVLEATRHRNKLRLGHLRGNHFTILIREVPPSHETTLTACLAILERRGAPNWFGPQRFGRYGNNHLIGRALLLGQWDDLWPALLTSATYPDERLEAARRALAREGAAAAIEELGSDHREERALLGLLQRHGGNPQRAADALGREHAWRYLTAYQSLLFNRCLARRLPALDRLEPGDIAIKHSNGAAFLVNDPAAESARLASFEISPAGPLFGSKLLAAAGGVAITEAEILTAERLSLDHFRPVIRGVRLTGARRPYRVPLRDWRHTWDSSRETSGASSDVGRVEEPAAEAREREPGALRVSFTLPAGSFATALLREIMQTPNLDPPA